MAGFFTQENSPALATAVMRVPLIITIASPRRLAFSTLLALTHVAATGSRTSMLSCAVTVIAVALIRRAYTAGVVHSSIRAGTNYCPSRRSWLH